MIQSEPTFFRSPFSRSKEETSDPEAMFSYEELQGEQDYPPSFAKNGISPFLESKGMYKTLPKALRTQALTTLTSIFSCPGQLNR